MRDLCAIAAVVALSTLGADPSFAADKADAPRLPLPAARIPALPRLRPAVVTAAGQRLLLADTDVAVSWDAANERLACDRPGWWVINYPLRKIRGMEGQTDDQIAMRLLGRPASAIKNWYFKAPGQPAAEPPAPTGPAPIECRANPTLVVGESAQFKTIQAAIDKAQPGDVVRVLPGIYRESIEAKQAGTRGKPIVIEGLRGAQGNMPVITGNDPFPANAWKPVPDAPGVFRADLFTRLPGTVSVNGNALVERSYYRELKPGEYCLNLATKEANAFRVPANATPSVGAACAGMAWTRVEADAEGFLDLARMPGRAAPNAVYYAFAYVWVEPKKVKEAWDPRFPQPITKRVDVPGYFRAARQTGSSLRSQLRQSCT